MVCLVICSLNLNLHCDFVSYCNPHLGLSIVYIALIKSAHFLLSSTIITTAREKFIHSNHFCQRDAVCPAVFELDCLVVFRSASQVGSQPEMTSDQASDAMVTSDQWSLWSRISTCAIFCKNSDT